MMKLIFNKRFLSHVAVLFLASAAAAPAALTSVTLPGTTASEAWTTFNPATFPGYPGYPGTADWPAPIASQTGDIVAPDTRATLNKTGNGPTGALYGGPYIGASYVYHGGRSTEPNVLGGSLRVSDAAPLIGVRTVVFQIEINNPFGHSFYNDVLPVLSFTAEGGLTSGVTASYVAMVDSEPAEPFMGNEVTRDTWALQWDLPEGVTEFSIDWSSVQHAQIYALQLDQGTGVAQGSVLPPAVPEPTTLALAVAGALVAVRRRRLA